MRQGAGLVENMHLPPTKMHNLADVVLPSDA
jgi:hypothetical protein